jgi:hypothetical protein
MAEVMVALAYADMGLAFSLVSHNNLAGAIAKKGSDPHRPRHLESMLDGSTLGKGRWSSKSPSRYYGRPHWGIP